MLNPLLPILVAALSTPALSAPYWITQYMLKIEQSPLTENELPLGLAEHFPQEEKPSPLASSSPLSLVYQFNDTAVLENIAVRHNNHLLLTPTSEAGVHYLNPEHGDPTLIAEFDGACSTVGIDETSHDVFAVAVGNYSTKTFAPTQGTFSIWSLDFNHDAQNPIKKKVADMPDAWALNGLTAIEGTPDLALVADSQRGWIWRVNMTTGEYDVAQKHVLYTNHTIVYGNMSFPLGVNGLQAQGGYLYFTNSAQEFYGRTAIDATGNALAEPEVIARAGPDVFSFDDLVVDWEGTAWIATHNEAVTTITLDGAQRNITGENDTTIYQPTGAAWGRGSHSKTLYIATAGDLLHGSSKGQVIALDTTRV